MGMYLSKGCTGHCTFCYNTAFHKNCYRSRNIDLFIEEVKYLKENHGLKAIAFTDELFGRNKETLREICTKFIEADLGVYWGGMTKIGLFDKEDFQLMHDAGCRWLEFGIESGAKTTLARMKKGYNPINQIVGYILSEDPTYITTHQGARNKIRKWDRDDILQSLLKSYLA